MKFLFSICLIALVSPLFAAGPKVRAIVERARATVGTEAVLDGLVTLRMSGWIEPAESKMPSATILIISRKPCSQRLEVKVDDMVETTILDGESGCIIRSNLSDQEKRSQMRTMLEEELKRAAFSTRQLFSFYSADFKSGERIQYKGIEQRRGVRCHTLLYSYPDGISTTRYFAVNDDILVSTVTDKGVESVEIGERIVDGIKFPKRVEYYEGNKMLHTVVISKVEVNKPLKASIFTIPTGQKTK
jgi:outer membrane lipoprotein-sorting protein